jgi:hypothetical protein
MTRVMPARAANDAFAPFQRHLEGLTDDDEAVRLRQSEALLLALEQAPPEIVQRVLDRLIAGLTSARKSARIGFSVTLTEAS